MYLLFVISILSFLMIFYKVLSQPILTFIGQDSAHIKQLKEERIKLKHELERTPMKENYTEFVRIERKVNKIDLDIQASKDGDVVKNFLMNYGINYGVKFGIGIALFLVTVLNRKHAVIVFSEKFDFSPFSGIISYPSNIGNSISLPFWVFINNYVFRQIASKIK